jgi:hypothetical protein
MEVLDASTAGCLAQRWEVPEGLAAEDQLGADVIEPLHRAVSPQSAGRDEADFDGKGWGEPPKEPDAFGIPVRAPESEIVVHLEDSAPADVSSWTQTYRMSRGCVK